MRSDQKVSKPVEGPEKPGNVADNMASTVLINWCVTATLACGMVIGPSPLRRGSKKVAVEIKEKGMKNKAASATNG